MRTLGLVALSVIAGSAVQAQTVKRTDLVGRWVEVGKPTGLSTLDLHADSTFNATVPIGAAMPKDSIRPGVLISAPVVKLSGGWSLIGDTILMKPLRRFALTPAGWQELGHSPASQEWRWPVALKSKRFTVKTLKPSAKPRIFERDDTTASMLSSMPMVQPQTLQAADLVGRWVAPGDTTRCMEFRADLSFTRDMPIAKEKIPPGVPNVDDGPAVSRIAGSWRIAGDTLALVPQKTAVRTASTWHDIGVQPGTGEVFTRRVRLEGKRLIVMPLTPHPMAEVFERDE